jgi:hypothetical protein
MLDALRPAAAAAAAAPPQRLAALGALSDAWLRADPDLAAFLTCDAGGGAGGGDAAAGMAAGDRRFGVALAALLV